MTLYLLQYNNYYNRTIKREDSLAAYLEYQIGNALTKVSFNPNDGVNTEQIINWAIGLEHPDYLLVVNDYNEIDSRWFVIDSTRTRGGQYKLLLRRDLVADFYEPIINAPVFIEKAKLRTTNNLIFNNEDMTYNQILDRKIPLMDETEVPWVVGYIPRDSFQQDTQFTITSYTANSAAADIEVADITEWEYYQYARPDDYSLFKATTAGLEFILKYSVYHTFTNEFYNLTSNMNPGFYSISSYAKASGGYRKPRVNIPFVQPTASNYTDATRYLFDNFRSEDNWISTILVNIKRQESDLHLETETYDFVGLNGKTIKDLATGNVFEIKISSGGPHTGTINMSSVAGQHLKTNFEAQTRPIKVWENYTFDSDAFGYTIPTYRMELTQITTDARITINNSRYHLEDAPYDMFCIPAGDLTIYANGVPSITCQGSLAMPIATAIGEKTGTGNIYDIQLLPYCPVRYMLKNGVIDTRSFLYHRVFDEQGGQISAIFWATKSSDNFIINETISVSADPVEFKAQNECDVFRLVSPNGNGMFEFKPTKNNGVNYFEADFTYKPFNPFIHVKPNFNRLYGDNPAKDFRGLICGGDFSITQLSNAWANYQQQNVNFQSIFNRQIENLEVNNAIQRQKEVASAIFGTIGAGISGASTGALVGGVYGAIAGGAAGTSLSAAGGMLDVQMADKLRAEALDYTKDQFGFQLGNIQAIPTSLAKTGAQVYVNTLFPTLEYYTCSQEERNALKNKIKYNGMTVMIIDNIYKYIWDEPTYIKGKLIRLEDTGEDYHIVNAISAELDKGVFI